MIRFGPWSTALAFGALYGLAVALALSGTRVNLAANRLLAALLVVIVLKLMPYVLGYAGFYDAYPWLSFAPFDLGLAIGPLLYLHTLRLTGATPQRGWPHLLPVAVQFTYYATAFAFPLAAKDAWNALVHEPFVVPVETAAVLCSMGAYLVLAWRRHRDYQRWLADHVSNREDFRLFWLRNFLVALSITLVAWTFTSAATAMLALDYFDRFPFYLGLTALVFYLGLEGWRHADRVYPVPADRYDPAGSPTALVDAADAIGHGAGACASALAPAEGRDWCAQGEAWLAATRTGGWWRDPELSLDRLARHLGTNTAYLSRALNEGLGLNFSEAIGQLRVAEVQRRLLAGEATDLLRCALEAGFSSKTSFNRVFKAQTGYTPSQFRREGALPGAES